MDAEAAVQAVEQFYAHSTPDVLQRDWQSLSDHLNAVAALANSFAQGTGFGPIAYQAGLLHDLGKYTKGFQERLSGGPPVDHSTAGAFHVLDLARSADERLFAELVAYAIAGHHSGLPDRVGGASSLSERLAAFRDAPNLQLDPAWKAEILPSMRKIALPEVARFAKDRLGFQLSFLGRMIFSCLVDADYRDTERFYATIEGRQVDRRWPQLSDRVDASIAALDAYLETRPREGPLNARRREILAHAREKAALAPGLFTLTVPTGGGKTLASLGFALEHAKRFCLTRIIYAIPFTSIIDQTAAIFRGIVGDDMLLEHHSAIDEEENNRRESRDKLKLAMEDWAAPIVVTTNVQFFESLFASRPSRCRKLHNIANSVVVLDEAQTIPLPLLRPCVAALDELARNYGVSIVLCTATQPALAAPHFQGGLRLTPERELALNPHRLASDLRRVTINRVGEMDDEGLVDALEKQPQGLVIVNLAPTH